MRRVSTLTAMAFVLGCASVATARVDPGKKSEPAANRAEVFFDSGRSVLRDGATRELKPLVTWARNNPSGIIVLDSYADPRGADPYNVRLSTHRGEAVRARLVELGVPHERIVLGIYGENGTGRTADQADRRVTAWGTTRPLYKVVDRTLGRKAIAVLWDQPVTLAELEGPNHPAVIAERQARKPQEARR